MKNASLILALLVAAGSRQIWHVEGYAATPMVSPPPRIDDTPPPRALDRRGVAAVVAVIAPL